MKLLFLTCMLLFVVVAEANKNHGIHKKYLKRDSNGNNTGSGVPAIYEPIVPIINQVNTDKQQVDPLSAVISWLTKKSYDGSRKHHLKRDGNTSTTISTTSTGQNNTSSSWFSGNVTVQPFTNSSSTHF